MLVGIYILGLIFVAIAKVMAGVAAMAAGIVAGVWGDIQDWRSQRS